LLLWVVLPWAATSQLLNNSSGMAFTDVPFFNESFIRNNHLKSLKGTYTFKKMGDIMRQTNYVYVYEFDTLGRLSQSYETRKTEEGKDTMVLAYGYDNQGRLEFIRRKDGNGFLSTHYTYDSIGRKVREEYRRDIDSMGSLLHPQFERSTVLNFETMSYQDYPGQQQKTVFNNYGFPYLQETSYFNADNYLIEREERLKMTSQTMRHTYEYNERGWISKISSVSVQDAGNNQELRFRYDGQGNLIEKHIYRNGVFTTDIQVIYNLQTGLLTSILTREVSSNFISILRFEGYQYF
jgi:YD repeat-containing protein